MNKMYKETSKMIFKLTALFSATMAFAAQDSLVAKQESLLQKLNTINESYLGFSIEGTAKSGYLNSVLKSDSLAQGSPSDETQAYSEMNLVFLARPSSETQARLEIRLHEDWQKAREQGVNPLLVHWWSYDGNVLDKHLKFNLGDMRLAYSPLTISLPKVKLIQEPEIFRARRLEAMAYKNLDDTDRRLMQGLNADYHSGSVSAFDDIHAQATVARLRNLLKKSDQVFFDFDESDRYVMATRGGASMFGASFGLTYLDVFDRVKSSRNKVLAAGQSRVFDENKVLSFELGFDAKNIIDPSVAKFGINAEYAKSNWYQDQDTFFVARKPFDNTYMDVYVMPDGLIDTTVYIITKYKDTLDFDHQKLAELNGTALLVNLKGSSSIQAFDLSGAVNYVANDEKFQSELAMNPAFMGYTPILNSDATFLPSQISPALGMIRSGTLENMYFSLYQSIPLTHANLMGKSTRAGIDIPPESPYYQLINNSRLAHYYRNGYNNQVLTRSEMQFSFAAMDPSASLAMPLGYATPNRSGLDLNFDITYLNGVTVNLLFGNFKEKVGDASYSQMGAGVGVDLTQFIEYSKALDLNVSYETTTESKGAERKSSRIMAGTKVGIWKGLSLLAGFQSLQKDIHIALGDETMGYTLVDKSSESLILAGPQVEITKGSVFSAQYGIMKNDVDFVDLAGNTQTISFDKSIITADITVHF